MSFTSYLFFDNSVCIFLILKCYESISECKWNHNIFKLNTKNQKITQSKAGLAQNTEYLLCSVPINIITQDYCENFHLVVIYRFSIFNLPFWNTSPICDNLGVFHCSMICKKLFKLLFRSLESENVENARVIFFSRKIYSPWSK